ncbi:methionyl-tRNA formyltransferase [Planctopirus limnophila DSM 3776]|uniref:Methionyl-tRNA formyltransferase n=1 Tax=Planctopirus limnophila (strain ATCC 43296 / DSM 3776 / IFAM 1008 / Mu 290) TaxID=521674 RepID=D5SQU0_PLAL2|nr:methionyl-tRNA formyltransferase [Planctopirus limnophila]ADG68552.1 methionyl-tRNA formyltransferase [Planctopirus limnophila DSM 3776]
MRSLRIAFLGTGPLARPVFEALRESPHHQVVALITQPSRTGRGHHQHENPLIGLAEERNIPVFQPSRIRDAEHATWLKELDLDLSVVAAYGQILSREILDLPRLGTINVHASLLPKYRGATPIHAAVLSGDEVAGVTIIRLVPKLDAGPMLGVDQLQVDAQETTGSLEARLAQLAVPLTLRVVDQLAMGEAQETLQDETLATHVGKLTKQHGLIDWSKPAIDIERHIRGMQPWPGPQTMLFSEGKAPLRLSILQGTVISSSATNSSSVGSFAEQTSPGQLSSESGRLFAQTGDHRLEILTLQPEGKRAMSAAEYLRGRPVKPGDYLGTLAIAPQ